MGWGSWYTKTYVQDHLLTDWMDAAIGRRDNPLITAMGMDFGWGYRGPLYFSPTHQTKDAIVGAMVHNKRWIVYHRQLPAGLRKVIVTYPHAPALPSWDPLHPCESEDEEWLLKALESLSRARKPERFQEWFGYWMRYRQFCTEMQRSVPTLPDEQYARVTAQVITGKLVPG